MGTNTRHVRLGAVVFAVSEAQWKLLRSIRPNGARHVSGGEVRSARVLESLGFGSLRDDGGIELRDGERWTFTLSDLPMGDAVSP